MRGMHTAGPAAIVDGAAKRRPGRLAALEIVAVASPSEGLTAVLRELDRLGARVRHVWPAPPVLPLAVDLLVCDYAADLAQRLAWLPGAPGAGLMIVLPSGCEPDIDALMVAAPDSILALPAPVAAIRANVMLALNQFRYGQRIRSKIERLEENIRSLRVIERAKAILMSKRKIGDEEAYQAIRELAMSKRVSVAMIATVIVDSSELLGESRI